jgi:hypothetical protein
MLSPQKYPNTSRTITGLLNDVFTSDVLIFCDTSTGAVALNLLEIPTGFWNTTYKLYVIDANNNAQTNNITINAPVGFQVNNASSFVISTNGGIALIRIINNTDYLAELNYNASALAVLNEGVLLTPNATSMDFIGSYVNATNVGSAVSVFIQPSIISLTYAQLQTAITNSTLIAGQMYSITNAIFIQTTGETAPIYLTATSTNTISAQGQGRFLNADYQLVGNYSGVTGFVSALGVWNLTLAIVVGVVVIWDNLQYVSLTGNNNQPDLNPSDWQLLSKTLTTGYILEVCTILYDVKSNSIYKRIDLNNNSVENNISSYLSVGLEAFQLFQWGASTFTKDNSVANESVLNNCNNQNYVWNNVINSASIVRILHGGDPQQTELKNNLICENSRLTFSFGAQFNRFNNNNLQNQAIVLIDPLGDPNTLNGLISENEFSNCNFGLAVFLVTDVLSGNIFNGFEGQIMNFGALFKNNSFISSGNYVCNISNQQSGGIFANFNENQFNFCNADITNLRNFNENLAEYSSLVIQSNSNNILNNSIRNSTFNLTQNFGNVNSNNIEDSTFIFGDVNVGAFIRYNELRSLSSINVTTCNNNIFSNEFQAYSFNVTTNNCNFGLNQLFNSSLTANVLATSLIRSIIGDLGITTLGTFSYNIGAGIIQKDVVTTSVFLDVSDPTIYDLPTQTLTIPNELEFVCGVIYLQNSSAPIIISKIASGLNQNYGAMKFINDTGFNVDFVATPIGLAGANDIISNLAPNTYTLVDRIDGTDSIYIRRLGTFVGVEQVYIYV